MTRLQARHLRPADLRGKTWRGYVRESTEEQTERGTPPARQKADILRAVEELGMVGEPFWYERSGSGESVSEELQRALNDAGQYDVLVAFATSRFARNRFEAVRMKAAFAEAGIIIYFASDRIISGARETRLTEGIKEVVDAEENETRRHWIAGGLRERQLSGRWVGTIPYGYRKHMSDNADGSRSWDGALELDPDEAGIVRRIFTDCLTGKSPGDIVMDLTAEGLTNRGAPWRKVTVRAMLSNPLYMGIIVRYRFTTPRHYYPESDDRDGRQTFDVPWGIVPREEWEAAQTMFPGHRRPKRSGHSYPLTGVLRCGLCGAKMHGAYNGKGDRYYRCSARASNRSLCEGSWVRADTLEDGFADWLDGFVLPEDWRQVIASQDRPKPAEDKQAKLRSYLERIKRLYLAGEMEWEEYDAERTKTKEKLAEHLPPDMVSLEALADVLAHIGPLWRADREPSLPPLIADRLVVKENRLAEIEVRASLRPLLEIACRQTPTRLTAHGRYYTPTIRYV